MASLPDSAQLVAGDLHRVLRDVFGHAEFRPSQQTICQAAAVGEDVLVVMPTGAGKSLCYQLPAIARGGTALVVSPLIALMEDQISKLAALGVAVDRIHSGRPREEARAAFRNYREGKLQFLFVAPERFRVPGFLDALTRRKPTLIAVDEAHCISQWGHDFRPDYRMLRDCVAALRPSPIIALTATATPAVQRDIVHQLNLQSPALFVQGFRRENVAIEVVETPGAERTALLWKILKQSERLPAIVYAPSRKQAEELAGELGATYRAAAYHAGVDSRHRQEVQTRFLTGQLDIIIATVAFGMGIDKPDIRTVVHVALPGSVEAYYQEIGRAGRDGKPSRAVLMHSYADRRMHDFFFERDYPDAQVLGALFRLLNDQPVPKEVLRERSKLGEDEFAAAFEKLWTHSGAVADWEENVTRGRPQWESTYGQQRHHRGEQVELVLRFASSQQCRMSALVRYFGDATDKRGWCGICDFCAPQMCVGQEFREAAEWEETAVRGILETLWQGTAKSTGKLHTEIFPTGNVSRNGFEELVSAAARAGYLVVTNESFEKDGRQIAYKAARLTEEGRAVRPNEDLGLLFRRLPGEERAGTTERKPRAKRAKTTQLSDGARVTAAIPAPAANGATTPAAGSVYLALKSWRLAEAKKRSVPAFRIFSDRVLQELAESVPASEEELLEIRGIGSHFAAQHGAAILRLLADSHSQDKSC